MEQNNKFESRSAADIPGHGGSGSGGDDGSGGGDSHRGKKTKYYYRHTQEQIKALEPFFKKCPHPNDQQRKYVARMLKLEPLQVKFWFQNKRTITKTKQDRNENLKLRAENKKIEIDNMVYKEALMNSFCSKCRDPNTIEELTLENARLQEELKRISAIIPEHIGKPMENNPILPPPVTGSPLDQGLGIGDMIDGPRDLNRSTSGPIRDANNQIITNLTFAAMEELLVMAQLDKPLWVPAIDGTKNVLNEEQYFMIFPVGIGPRPTGFKSEASRENAIVMMSPIKLVEILMDVNQWSTVFSCIVLRASTLEVLSTGVAGSYHETIQVMNAEFQLPSPLVPTRESYFVRYCKRHWDGSWSVVDVLSDSVRPSPLTRCRRRPSGCLIQEMPNGYSKVTWVEHVDVDDSGVHLIYKPMINAGLAFGAKRWVATLDRQCERLASAMATNVRNHDINNIEGIKSMMKLAERMVMNFCAAVSASTADTWTSLSGSGASDIRIMTRMTIDDPRTPIGTVLSATTTFWLPLPSKGVLDFLRNESSRSEWDILSTGRCVQEMAHIANGRETSNCVSLFRVNHPNSSQSNLLILQETCFDPTTSFFVYAPVDPVIMNEVLSNRDPNCVSLLPSGFAIHPGGPTMNAGGIGESGGSLVTLTFQIFIDSLATTQISLGPVDYVNNLINSTIAGIKAALARRII